MRRLADGSGYRCHISCTCSGPACRSFLPWLVLRCPDELQNEHGKLRGLFFMWPMTRIPNNLDAPEVVASARHLL